MLNWFRRRLVGTSGFWFITLVFLHFLIDLPIVDIMWGGPPSIEHSILLTLMLCCWAAVLRSYKDKWSRIFAAEQLNTKV